MKTLAVIIFAAVHVILNFIPGEIHSQDKSELVEIIKNKVEDIHLDTNLKSVTLQNEEFLDNMTDGGGELTGFYKKNTIYKIYQSVGISCGVYITEFYYSKNQLIFVRDKFNKYILDTTNSLDFSKTENSYSGYYYFNKGKLIHSDIRGENRFASEPTGPQEYFLTESGKNIELIRKKL